ncbi:MAG: prolipoprotein diacylglyceryl transferase [Candidatus Hydrogenedentes bacterium]|nr:prolipoprotein diacylglyceryl transferase [Candidatus Hydrogenedentota bacterium]
MLPTLIKVGELELHSYVVCLALGLFVSVTLALRENQRLPNPYPVDGKVGIWALIFGLLGGRIYQVLQYEGIHKIHEAIVYFWAGGYVFFGAFLGGLLGVWLYLRRRKVPFLPASDIAVPYIALGHAIGRVGCFLNGCCWGDLCNFPWAIVYPKDSDVFDKQIIRHLIPASADQPLPVHPTPLYEVLGLLIIFILLRMIYKNKNYDGQVLLWYFCMYGAWRFLDENFRGESYHTHLGMTASQMIALVVCLLASVLLFIMFLMLKKKQLSKKCNHILNQKISELKQI